MSADQIEEQYPALKDFKAEVSGGNREFQNVVPAALDVEKTLLHIAEARPKTLHGELISDRIAQDIAEFKKENGTPTDPGPPYLRKGDISIAQRLQISRLSFLDEDFLGGRDAMYALAAETFSAFGVKIPGNITLEELITRASQITSENQHKKWTFQTKIPAVALHVNHAVGLGRQSLRVPTSFYVAYRKEVFATTVPQKRS